MNDMIEITTPLPDDSGTVVKKTISKQEFLEDMVLRSTIYGDDVLENWLKYHDISRAEASEMCGVQNIPEILDRAKMFRATAPPQNDVEGAAQGHHVSELRIQQLATNAEHMSTSQLEEALVNAGMQVNRSTLMR